MIKDRNGRLLQSNETQGKVLNVLYKTFLGRTVLLILTRPLISKIVSILLNSRISKFAISPFIINNGIRMNDYENKSYRSYNDFFIRNIITGSRKISMDENHLISPCDSKLTVYDITSNAHFKIKNTEYSMRDLVKSTNLSKRYEGGKLLLFRLTVDDYHHYCYVDDGEKTNNHHIKGVLHTVNPLANDIYPIYKENSREYSILYSKNFGHILMMEVGALMVGKIVNLHEKSSVLKGQEKGYFEFGGSTVIICLEKNKVVIDSDIIENSKNNVETAVKYGEKIGIKNVTV